MSFKPYKITIIQEIKSHTSWTPKIQGVILVEKEEDIDPLFELLNKYDDDYWRPFKHLIQVAPKKIDSEMELQAMCDYVGKTDIWDEHWNTIQSQVPFFVYQYVESDFY